VKVHFLHVKVIVSRLLLMCSSQTDAADISEAITLSDKALLYHSQCYGFGEKNCNLDGGILLLSWRTVKEFCFVV
jgi:hypothetical protein